MQEELPRSKGIRLLPTGATSCAPGALLSRQSITPGGVDRILNQAAGCLWPELEPLVRAQYANAVRKGQAA